MSVLDRARRVLVTGRVGLAHEGSINGHYNAPSRQVTECYLIRVIRYRLPTMLLAIRHVMDVSIRAPVTVRGILGPPVVSAPTPTSLSRYLDARRSPTPRAAFGAFVARYEGSTAPEGDSRTALSRRDLERGGTPEHDVTHTQEASPPGSHGRRYGSRDGFAAGCCLGAGGPLSAAVREHPRWSSNAWRSGGASQPTCTQTQWAGIATHSSGPR